LRAPALEHNSEMGTHQRGHYTQDGKSLRFSTETVSERCECILRDHKAMPKLLIHKILTVDRNRGDINSYKNRFLVFFRVLFFLDFYSENAGH